MEVRAHQAAGNTDGTVKQYDVSVKAGNTMYVVLFTSPSGSNLVEYKTGMDVLVQVEGNTMKFKNLTGNSEAAPILSRKEIPSNQPK
jgi:hypothetical protein